MNTRSEFDHCLNNVAMQFRRPGGRNPWLQPQDVAAAREHVRYGELLAAFEAAAARDGLTRDHLRGGAMLLFEACGYERIPLVNDPMGRLRIDLGVENAKYREALRNDIEGAA